MSSGSRTHLRKAELTNKEENDQAALSWKRISSEELKHQRNVEESVEVGLELKRKIRRAAENDRAEPLYIAHV